MPSIIACDQASMSWARSWSCPVTDFRHSPESGSAKSAQQVGRAFSASPSRMRSACGWNSREPVRRTACGDTAGKKIERSAMCASPSLRIMLWPISLTIRPAGWSDENTSMRFSETKMSSRRVSSVFA